MVFRVSGLMPMIACSNPAITCPLPMVTYRDDVLWNVSNTVPSPISGVVSNTMCLFALPWVVSFGIIDAGSGRPAAFSTVSSIILIILNCNSYCIIRLDKAQVLL